MAEPECNLVAYSYRKTSCEKRIWHSDYFQQNSYFAEGSKAPPWSEPNSDKSKVNELEELDMDLPETLRSMVNLGSVYCDQSRLEETEQLDGVI